MWKRKSLISGIGILAIFLGVAIFALSGVAKAGPPLEAEVSFGQDTGSHKPRGHDQSDESKDTLVPRTVVISQGGTVTFDIEGSQVHQVIVLPAGTKPADVDDSVRTGFAG